MPRRSGVDAYSTNQALQDQLDRLAWASAAGNLTLGAASIATGAVVLQVASNVRTLEQARSVIEATPPSELARRNRATLHRLGVPDAVTARFLADHALSPRHQTIIAESMVSLGNIPGRGGFIGYAAQARSEDQAFFFQQAAELLAGYSAVVSRITQVGVFANLPVGYDAAGKAVLLLPIDRLLWTPRSADLAGQIAQNLPKPKTVRATEIWITGTASAKAVAALGGLGLGLTQNCDSRIRLLD